MLSFLVLLASLTSLNVAWSAPTLEEDALAALLEGRSAAAVRILERGATTNPDLRWVAGMIAIDARDFQQARRLLDLDGKGSAWGAVEILAAQGRDEEAARVAIDAMGKALGTEHADALGTLLIAWAKDRSEKDPQNAARLLEAVLGFECSDSVRREAEDVLFLLDLPSPSPNVLLAARKRLLSDASDLGARRIWGRHVARTDPHAALAWLRPVLVQASREEALTLTSRLSDLDLPTPERIELLHALLARFPSDDEVGRYVLERMKRLASEDARLLARAWGPLASHPKLGGEASLQWALLTPDPVERRRRLLEFAERERASMLAETARDAATAALIEAASAAREPATRVRLAREALERPEEAMNLQLSYLALPGTWEPRRPGAEPARLAGQPDASPRLVGLWDLANRFPGARPWCPELAERLLEAGVDRAEAGRFERVCGKADDEASSALTAFAREGDFLGLRPIPGGLEVLAVGTMDELLVTEHAVDPRDLFLASTEHPLDWSLDAFLVIADREWKLPFDREILRPVRIGPRISGRLSALSVRAGDQRATSLVPRKMLELRGFRHGDRVDVVVLEGGEPSGSCRLLLQDGGGGPPRELVTRRDGLASFDEVQGEARILAWGPRGIGYAFFSGAHGAARADAEGRASVRLVLPERAIEGRGRRTEVHVFGTLPEGDASGGLRLRSRASDGELIEEISLKLTAGRTSASLWAQGGGTVEAVLDDETTSRIRVPLAYEGGMKARDTDLKVRFSDPAPHPGDPLEVEMRLVGAIPLGGRAASVVLHTPWDLREEEILLGAEPIRWPVDLSLALPGERITLHVKLSDDLTLSTEVLVQAPEAPLPPQLPEVVTVAQPLPCPRDAETWLRASDEHSRVLWFEPSAPLVVPVEGIWQVTAWRRGLVSSAHTLAALSAGALLDANGRLTGDDAALLGIAHGRTLVSTLLRPGQRASSPGPIGRLGGWRVVDAGRDEPIVLPLAEAPRPTLTVEGRLLSEGVSSLVLGRGLPEGTRLWAFLRDDSDLGVFAGGEEIQTGVFPGRLLTPTEWDPSLAMGEEIAAALLEEERRVAEVRDMRLVDFDFSADLEQARSMGFGSFGHAGAGYGSGGGIGSLGGAPIILGSARGVRRLDVDPEALAVVLDTRPGAWRLELPAWVSAVSVEIIARTPEGRWLHRVVLLPVEGPLKQRPQPEPPVPALAWDGNLDALERLADALPDDARRLALASLVRSGREELRPRLMAAQALESQGEGVALAQLLIASLPATNAEKALARLEGLPDQRRAERAEAALLAAKGQPERALAAARRLLKESDLEPRVRARAAMALHLAGREEEARAALELEGRGQDLHLALTRAVLTKRTLAEDLPRFWTLARNEAAQPTDRALAIAALSQLPGRRVDSLGDPGSAPTLEITLEPAVAMKEGRLLPRGRRCSADRERLFSLEEPERLIAGRTHPLRVRVPEHPLPTRLACPTGDGFRSTTRWVDLPPAWASREVTCEIRLDLGREGAKLQLQVSWHAPDGGVLGRASLERPVDPWRESSVSDPMSPDETLALGAVLARKGLPEGVTLLRSLLGTPWLGPDAVVEASAALLAGAERADSPALLIAAFESYRERVPNGRLELDTAAAVARAYAATGEPRRALEATRVVLDARFREELAAVRSLQEGGLSFTALKLLRELLSRYPELPTVVEARYLSPFMLLDRAGQDGGDLMGYTRSSLRHTAVADLARFILLHPEDARSAEGAGLLLETLTDLQDPRRVANLAGPLFRRFKDHPEAWRLALADARARFAEGRFAASLGILERLDRGRAQPGLLDLEMGRAQEALGRIEVARKLYERSALPEAQSRLAWLDRSELRLPAFLALQPRDPAVFRTRLPAGTQLDVAAHRIALESLLLRDEGRLDADRIHLDGLGTSGRRTLTLGADGLIPIPMPREGAYLVTVTFAGGTHRSVVIRSSAELSVMGTPASDSLVQVMDLAGRPLDGASLWCFDASGFYEASRTDPLGAAHVEGGNGRMGVLVRAGDRYAWWSPLGLNVIDDGWMQEARRQAAPRGPQASEKESLLKAKADDYGTLFKQARRGSVSAGAL